VYDIHVRLGAVHAEQYFEADPSVPSAPEIVDVTLPDTAFTMETDRGVFSHGHLDTATSLLLRAMLPWPDPATCSTSAAAPGRSR
jgi:16S rRNA G1207 methylase RsmC